MKNSWKSIVITLLVIILFVTPSVLLAQAPASSVKPAATSSAAVSEATVDSFLKQMFGWNQDLTWKIAEIKPAEAQGFTEVTAVFNTPQGQQVFRVYVTPDQKFALTGDMVPFGADPFAAAMADLTAVNGPVHGPADATVTIV